MKIIFADDHQMILGGLTSVIKSHFKSAEVYTALNKNELFIQLKTSSKIEHAEELNVLVQDIKFGAHNANDFLQEIRDNYPKLKILVLSSVSNSTSIQQILKKVDGYVLKSESIEEIINGIETICKGDYFISPMAKKIIGQVVNSNEIILTRREKEVLSVLMQEKSTKEIAEVLCISQKTVEMHRSNLFVKLDVKNITGLVKQVIALDLLGN